MYDYIKGTLTKLTQETVTVEAQGVGYKLFISSSELSKLPSPGSQVTLFTSFVIREFSQTLFGFLTEEERELFEALLNISGIGPKTSLAIIGHLSVAELQSAVVKKDVNTLCKVPGIGKKTAERLLVELKDTLAKLSPEASKTLLSHSPAKEKIGLAYDAVSALVNLGYSQMVAQNAVKKVQDLEEVENLEKLITLSLQKVHTKGT